MNDSSTRRQLRDIYAGFEPPAGSAEHIIGLATQRATRIKRNRRIAAGGSSLVAVALAGTLALNIPAGVRSGNDVDPASGHGWLATDTRTGPVQSPTGLPSVVSTATAGPTMNADPDAYQECGMMAAPGGYTYYCAQTAGLPPIWVQSTRNDNSMSKEDLAKGASKAAEPIQAGLPATVIDPTPLSGDFKWTASLGASTSPSCVAGTLADDGQAERAGAMPLVTWNQYFQTPAALKTSTVAGEEVEVSTSRWPSGVDPLQVLRTRTSPCAPASGFREIAWPGHDPKTTLLYRNARPGVTPTVVQYTAHKRVGDVLYSVLFEHVKSDAEAIRFADEWMTAATVNAHGGGR